MNKITVIGTGNVGATVAYTLTTAGVASEIVLIDINTEKALGEALDIRQGVPFFTPCNIYAGSYQDAVGSDIVVITSGIARKPGQTRLELAQTNVNILKAIAKDVVKYAPDATYVIVSNPVDVLTYVFAKVSGIPENRVIGSGTILDTARLRSRISEYYSVSQKNVHAFVLGEHGDSSFVPWSQALIASNHISKFKEHAPEGDKIDFNFDYDAWEESVRTAGAVVIKSKGFTNYAVASSVCHIVRCINNGSGTAITLSTMMEGEYGVDDVCLSVLCLVDGEGIRGKVIVDLTDEEQAKLQASANKLKETLAAIEW